MKLAIMQPYLFPYIGYFQLINVVDKFVIYDDVNFIKQGWINRNNILVQGKPLMFTVPLVNQSSFAKINEIEVNSKLYDSWRKKFLRTIEQSYKKAPYFKEVFDIVSTVVDVQGNENSISDLATKSLVATSNYLGLKTEFVFTSEVYGNQILSGPERVIDICKKENATNYINPIGGQELYSQEVFEQSGLDLKFIKSLPLSYDQFNGDFVPWLSMIDILMFNSIEQTKLLLDKYELL
jgi:hypothetical protein